MYTKTAIALLSILVPFAAAKCYEDAVANANPQFALDNVQDAATFLQGELAAGQVRGLCVTDPGHSSYHWFYSIRNTGSNGFTVEKDWIATNFRTEIQGCGTKGGYRGYDDIQYNVDPNLGICVDGKYIDQHEPAPMPPYRRGAVIPRAYSGIVFTEVSDIAAIRPEALQVNATEE